MSNRAGRISIGAVLLLRVNHIHASVRYLCCGNAVQRVRGMEWTNTPHSTDHSTSNNRYSSCTSIYPPSHGTQIFPGRHGQHHHHQQHPAHSSPSTHKPKKIGGIEIPTHNPTRLGKKRKSGEWDDKKEGEGEKRRKEGSGGRVEGWRERGG